MSLKESNAQYYSGQHLVTVPAVATTDFTFSNFNTKLVSAFNTDGIQVASASNFSVYRIASGGSAPTIISESDIAVINPEGTKIRSATPYTGGWLLCQLKTPAVQSNYGSYEYTSLNDIINNFLISYVGEDKLIPKVKRSDVIFFAKRGLQEFSYDTLRSIKSQELNIPPSLSVPIPQDYVNYVRVSWIDDSGVRRIIYPTRLTTNPTELPIQDSDGIPTQNWYEQNLDAEQSQTEEKWREIDWKFNQNWQNFPWEDWYQYYPTMNWYGRLYGQDQETAQVNGWFTINEREGKFSFSSGLVSKLIVLEYISDGLASTLDTKVPKMAEEAMYMHIAYSILAGRRNIPEYIVRRFKKDRSAALRNAKIRLSNIKSEEFTQVFRGKSKWIKH
jgi:hypothetical protein|tara:strand:- start:1462 stop:2628 length:1167 start_codon:yes stop_codon:yes gene_type:complete